MADDERKRRLQELRDKAAAAASGGKPGDTNSAVAAADSDERKKQAVVKFRNYHPQDVALHTNKKRPLGSDAEEGKGAAADGTENASKAKRVEAQDAEVDVITKELRANKSDEVHIVPKNPNWDLKNQVASKLDRLRRRTQRAIVELLRERVTGEDASQDEGQEGGEGTRGKGTEGSGANNID
jgi:coiled-coil domain-containing protein 12